MSKASDLHGLVRLGVDAGLGITDVVEGVHASVLRRLGLAGRAGAGRTDGITGAVYAAVRGVARGCSQSADAALGLISAAAPSRADASGAGPEAARAVLNGVWGDHLAASANPLAITMAFRAGGRVVVPERLRRADARGRLVVLVHGLCMNDLQWRRPAVGALAAHDHGAMLERDGTRSVLRLHYNSGRHVFENGRLLAGLLAGLVQRWPVPVHDLALVGHSMGGLVIRSACHEAAVHGQPWLQPLRRLVFLGTPHHGAPLERAGRALDTLLGASVHALPFLRLTRARSAGITDLRYGNLQPADLQGADRHEQRRDDRVPTPLPAGVGVGVVAATTAPDAGSARARWMGDGLVPLASALGNHADPALDLTAPAGGTLERLVLARSDHFGLLSHPDAAVALQRWLA